jgi:hypothetical protein
MRSLNLKPIFLKIAVIFKSANILLIDNFWFFNVIGKLMIIIIWYIHWSNQEKIFTKIV